MGQFILPKLKVFNTKMLLQCTSRGYQNEGNEWENQQTGLWVRNHLYPNEFCSTCESKQWSCHPENPNNELEIAETREIKLQSMMMMMMMMINLCWFVTVSDTSDGLML